MRHIMTLLVVLISQISFSQNDGDAKIIITLNDKEECTRK
jgi:hypothetical protein